MLRLLFNLFCARILGNRTGSSGIFRLASIRALLLVGIVKWFVKFGMGSYDDQLPAIRSEENHEQSRPTRFGLSQFTDTEGQQLT